MLSECHYSVTVSGSGIYAVIYYAGHGFELDGENYLLPVDAMSPDPNESIRAQEFLQEMQSCDTLLNLMFLDCCRTRYDFILILSYVETQYRSWFFQ